MGDPQPFWRLLGVVCGGGGRLLFCNPGDLAFAVFIADN